MTGKEQTKTLKRCNLIPRNIMIEEQITLLKYMYIFVSGIILGIFTQVL